jgi:hypothetical protein
VFKNRSKKNGRGVLELAIDQRICQRGDLKQVSFDAKELYTRFERLRMDAVDLKLKHLVEYPHNEDISAPHGLTPSEARGQFDIYMIDMSPLPPGRYEIQVNVATGRESYAVEPILVHIHADKEIR